ncbi:M48 family metalloprotease [Cylindrospermopsis raciborskii]|uniref:M48 family metalloprotease n=1 Tax=Cylindrospermopsis raciborskii TaxID=77022 RepID=UPI00387A1FD3
MVPSQKSSLEKGLSALKQGSYYAAISSLVPIVNRPDNHHIKLQAQVGLVMAYAHTGELSKAIAVCRTLVGNDNAQPTNSQVQQWAKVAIEHLIKRQQRQQAKQSRLVAQYNLQNDRHLVDSKQTISNEDYEDSDQVERTNTKSNIANSPNIETASIYWRQAKRAKVWQPLRKYHFIRFAIPGMITMMALFFIWQFVISLIFISMNEVLHRLPYVDPLPFLYVNPTLLISTSLLFLLLFIMSPWLLDGLLAKFYHQQPFSKEALHRYSRESVRIIQRTCQLRKFPLPQLKILPLTVPIIFTYGNLPQTARIVVSQGMLTQLAEDEIGTVYALALGQIDSWGLGIMSLAVLISLPFYLIYQQTAIWSTKNQNILWHWITTGLGSVSYGIWSLFTATTFINSRLRFKNSDRQAVEMTGNPNGLIRALLKNTIGIARNIKNQQQTSWELESLNIVAPVDYKHSLFLGSTAGQFTWESLLIWENNQPYRQWFTLNNSHPLLGDRLENLCQIAHQWYLDTELYPMKPNSPQITMQSFLLQIAPFLGIPIGLGMGVILWLTWQIGYGLELFHLKWIYDGWSFLVGFLMIGFSIGTIVRLNALFPGIKPENLNSEKQMLKFLTNPVVLPINSLNIRISGRLLGRRGSGNCVGQDLILESEIGLIKLHHVWFPTWRKLMGEQITLTGWLRRGATPWVDVHSLETINGKIIYGHHPIWSTVIALIAQFWGAYILLMEPVVGGL